MSRVPSRLEPGLLLLSGATPEASVGEAAPAASWGPA
jgi:hypothetical protein